MPRKNLKREMVKAILKSQNTTYEKWIEEQENKIIEEAISSGKYELIKKENEVR